MSQTSALNQNSHGFVWLIRELDSRKGPLDEATACQLLAIAHLDLSEVGPYVERPGDSYARRCVVRRENYEILVLTWSPAQGTVAHDHSGSLCALKVVQGSLTEQHFSETPDGCVRMTTKGKLGPGEIIADPGVVVHALTNDVDSTEVLVTVHVYSPPLPEVRRYAVGDGPVPKLFLRPAQPDAKVIAVVGGGFTGVMTMANLLRLGREVETPLHIVLIDRQPSIGEGIAYRTNDARHLLNVPAGLMSAWPDLPEDFLSFARSKDPSVAPRDFLPRKIYGEYIRKTVFDLAEAARDHLTAEVVRDEVTSLAPGSSGWDIMTDRGRSVRANLAILAVGHRPPTDPLEKAWSGPRLRFVADPWAALVLSQIGPDEPVLLIGSGLTAVDVTLTLNRPDRSAPILALSRRGLLPLCHARHLGTAGQWPRANGWLESKERLTARQVVAELRRQIRSRDQGVEWQHVIDALRPSIPQLWNRLDVAERMRFMRHLRPFWEIHRHRMAPVVGETIERLLRQNIFKVLAGSLISAEADSEGVDVRFASQGIATAVRVSWVVNCTGPGAHTRHGTHPFLRPLLEAGTICGDELSLGLLTDPWGRAINRGGGVHPGLLVAGTLRKATLWESTAVPELARQAQTTARTAFSMLLSREPLLNPARLNPTSPHEASGS